MQNFEDLDPATEEQLRLNNFEVQCGPYCMEVELMVKFE